MNSYHSFYLSDLEAKIREVALQSMIDPRPVGSVEEFNSRVALYNSGIRDMATKLIMELEKEAGNDTVG